uniref:Uncharacterized protein n=1 Tax=viral metagenome TaxID=1070528 RepID=A0A6C0I110_9ZZZZ
MGCDYYISKSLYIYYNNNEYLEIILEKLKRYYDYQCDEFDEDEEETDFEERENEYIKYTLTPKMNPIMIYNNNIFNKLLFEIKYKELLDIEINKYNKTWHDIIKIIKVEKRFER